MATLTKRQKQIYDFIRNFIYRKGLSPTLEEIKRHFRLSTLSTIHEHIAVLVKKGFITKSDNASRGIEIEQAQMITIPLLGIIAAGQPIEAIVNPGLISVPRSIISRPGKYYALSVSGDSMIGEGILDGDTVIIKKQDIVENGETAVALINDNEATLKKIYTEKGRFRLQPANPRMKPIFVKRLTIQGKVAGVLRAVK